MKKGAPKGVPNRIKGLMPSPKKHTNSKEYPAGYSPQPNDINTVTHFWGAFGDYNLERAAIFLIRMCQERGTGWKCFTKKQFEDYQGDAAKYLEDLVDYGVLVKNKAYYYFTHEFVINCFRSMAYNGPKGKDQYQKL